MQKIFLAVIDMSIVSSLVILAVLLVRALLKRAPRRFAYVLWAAVLLRLLCPFAVESPLSLIPERAGDIAQSSALPESEKVTFVSAASAAYRAIGDTANGGRGVVRVEVGAPAPVQSGEQAEREYVSASHGQVWLLLCAWLWPAGTAAVLVWGIVGQIKLRRMLVGAVKLEDGVWLADHIPTAFVMGLLRPKIYLPSDLDGPGRDYVLEHERAHVRRGDHITRLLAFAALALHWFNPLVWLAFAMSGRDMEMSCDEAVMRRSGVDIRADYCQTLLDMSANKHFPSPCLLAFGESDTGARVRNALRWKKPAFWAVTAAAALIAAACVLLLTNPLAKKSNTIELSFPAYQNGRNSSTVYDTAYDLVPFSMSVTLPKGWTAEAPQELRVRMASQNGDPAAADCTLYTPVYLYDAKGEYAGFVGWSDYDEYNGDDVPEGDYYKTVYYSLRLGAHYAWTNYEPLKADEYTETHTATVYYQVPDGELPAAAWPQHAVPGICHYDKRLGVYVAMQLVDGAATEKEILEIADSIALSVPDSGLNPSTVEIGFSGAYTEDGESYDCGSFIASLELPARWTVQKAGEAAPDVPLYFLTSIHGIQEPVEIYDKTGVLVGVAGYRVFDPDRPNPYVQFGGMSEREHYRMMVYKDISGKDGRDYELINSTDTTETTVLKTTSYMTVGMERQYHDWTQVLHYDTDLGAYVAVVMYADAVTDGELDIIAQSLRLRAGGQRHGGGGPVSIGFDGYVYDGEDGSRSGPGPFLVSMDLPEGWTISSKWLEEGRSFINYAMGISLTLYDELNRRAGVISCDLFDPDLRYPMVKSGSWTDEDYERAKIYYDLTKERQWHDLEPVSSTETAETSTAYVEHFYQMNGENGYTSHKETNRGICRYDKTLGVYVSIELYSSVTDDGDVEAFASSLNLQRQAGRANRELEFVVPGYVVTGQWVDECMAFSAAMTLPEGWEVIPGAGASTAKANTYGMLPLAYMYAGDGRYAGFIAWDELTRPITANHYEWEDFTQVADGGTDVYTATVIYDEYDESLLPGHPWTSFETVGIRAESETLGVYMCVQFTPGVISEDEMNEMALSIGLSEAENYVASFGGAAWGTSIYDIHNNLSHVLMKGEPLRSRWSFHGRECVAYYRYDPYEANSRLIGGDYSFNEEQTLTRQEQIELYKELLEELTLTYGEPDWWHPNIRDGYSDSIQAVIDGDSDDCFDVWERLAPDGRSVGILLELDRSGNLTIGYDVKS